MEHTRLKVRSLWLTLAVSTILMALKFTAYQYTHSNAVLTDALESIINIIAGVFALYCTYFAAQPKDADHPYGHGKIEFLSAGFEGGLIFVTGLYMVGKATVDFFYEKSLSSIDIGIGISVIAGGLNFILGRFLLARGKKFNSLIMIADGQHLMMDTLSGAGVIIGLTLIYYFKIYWLDNVTAIVIGGFILHTGYVLIKESLTGLLDETDFEKVDELVEILDAHRHNNWIDIHNMRLIRYGSHLHVDCHLTLPWYDSLEHTHDEVHAFELLIKKHLGPDVEFFIHTDPCIPETSCPICPLLHCQVRKVEFSERLKWTAQNVLPNQKHKKIKSTHVSTI